MFAAKWIDCEWKASPPSSALEARIFDPDDEKMKEYMFVVDDNFVNFTGLELSLEKQYIIGVQNASIYFQLAGKLRKHRRFE